MAAQLVRLINLRPFGVCDQKCWISFRSATSWGAWCLCFALQGEKARAGCDKGSWLAVRHDIDSGMRVVDEEGGLTPTRGDPSRQMTDGA